MLLPARGRQRLSVRYYWAWLFAAYLSMFPHTTDIKHVQEKECSQNKHRSADYTPSAGVRGTYYYPNESSPNLFTWRTSSYLAEQRQQM